MSTTRKLAVGAGTAAFLLLLAALVALIVGTRGQSVQVLTERVQQAPGTSVDRQHMTGVPLVEPEDPNDQGTGSQAVNDPAGTAARAAQEPSRQADQAGREAQQRAADETYDASRTAGNASGGRAPMSTTSHNLAVLQAGVYSNDRLKHTCTTAEDRSGSCGTELTPGPAGPGSKAKVQKVNTNDTRVCDHYAEGSCIQCVTFVRGMSYSKARSGDWRPGTSIRKGTTPVGTVIATFNGNSYGGHVAIFGGYNRNSRGAVTSMTVYDQNWVASGVVGRHSISFRFTSGVSTGDAADYYEVLAPPNP